MLYRTQRKGGIRVYNEITWPNTKDPAIWALLHSEFKNHPEKYCGRGGKFHRFIKVLEEQGTGPYGNPYSGMRKVCIDCGKEYNFSIIRKPDGNMTIW